MGGARECLSFCKSVKNKQFDNVLLETIFFLTQFHLPYEQMSRCWKDMGPVQRKNKIYRWLIIFGSISQEPDRGR